MRKEDYPVYSISKNKANRAGKILVDSVLIEERIDAFEIMEQWRALHAYPLDFYDERVRELIRAGGDENRFTVARRIKRIPSIYRKLERFPEMSLGRMQDIGGIRAIVPTADDVDAFCERLTQAESVRTLKRICDYVAKPKKSGYRSRHLIYEFNDDDSPQEYRGLSIEVQIRSRVQHAWATTLETFAVFLGQAFKSGLGSRDYLTFFETSAAALALYENRPRPEKYAWLDAVELIRNLRGSFERLGIRESLAAFSKTISVVYAGESDSTASRGDYLILKLNPNTGKVLIHPCGDAAEARWLYVDLERFKAPGEDVVLVSVGDVSAIREAYPNYFADAKAFLAILDELFETYR